MKQDISQKIWVIFWVYFTAFLIGSLSSAQTNHSRIPIPNSIHQVK